jgi:hypothetical protein
MAVGETITSLNAVTTTGAGSSNEAKSSRFTCVIVYATAAPTLATVKLQGSLDNTSWVDLGSTTDVSATTVGFSVDGKYAMYVRGNLSSYTAGSCTGVTMKTLAERILWR